MCGLAGVVQQKPVEKSLVVAMAQTLLHRGPDFTGYFFDEHAGFLHNRLSLLDLSNNGNQPFTDEDHVLLYNGEIYNHLELRETHLGDHKFKSTSDTETLFLLLKKLGIRRTSNIIEGMYAFAFYDRKSNETYLVRDKLGIKPLFYSNYQGGLIFSSELKGLTKHFSLKINKLKIQSAALGEFEYSRTHTAFESVSQVEPGTIVKYDLHQNRLEITDYFQLTDFIQENEYNRLANTSKSSLIEEFEFLFKSSVEKMLLSDVPVGAFVSGGIDSSIIAATVAAKKNINLYTANVEGKYSELEYSELLAEQIKMPLSIHTHHPEDLIKNLVETTWYYDAPIVVHPSSIPFQGVASLAKREGIKPVLTGEGSDELFLGYPRLLTKRWDKLIRMPFELTEKAYRKIPGLTRYLNLNKVNYNRDLLYHPFNMERNSNNEKYENHFSFVEDKAKRKEHILSIEMLGRSLHSLLWRNDRMGMMHSLEARFPFLDDAVIKFSINLPIQMKIGRTNKLYNYKHPFLIDKYIVRKISEKKLPNKLIYRKKDGFPLYGFLHTQIERDFFKNGFLQNLMEWTEEGRKLFESETDSYLKSKLACVEIWGRLFINNEKIEEVKKVIEQKIKIKK